jgi:hypothetical protein
VSAHAQLQDIWYSLLSPGSDDSDATSSDIPKSDVETSEVGTDDKEHSKGLLGVLDLWQERGVQSERQGDLCSGSEIVRSHTRLRRTGRLVEVALENVLVEHQQCLQDLESVLVGSLLPDLQVQVLV